MNSVVQVGASSWVDLWGWLRLVLLAALQKAHAFSKEGGTDRCELAHVDVAAPVVVVVVHDVDKTDVGPEKDRLTAVQLELDRIVARLNDGVGDDSAEQCTVWVGSLGLQLVEDVEL